jgi:hypothetical protein
VSRLAGVVDLIFEDTGKPADDTKAGARRVCD